MRIIGGIHKGKRITAPKKLPVRPTTDRTKESLFNILGNQYFFEDLKVLDLFAGTGNISYEFASRGAQNITAIDAHFGCTKFIQKMAGELQINIRTLKTDVFKYLDQCNEQFDLIFADPPYHFDLNALELLHQKVLIHNILTQNGVMIMEHAGQTNVSHLKNFDQQRKYGSCVLSFFNANA